MVNVWILLSKPEIVFMIKLDMYVEKKVIHKVQSLMGMHDFVANWKGSWAEKVRMRIEKK